LSRPVPLQPRERVGFRESALGNQVGITNSILPLALAVAAVFAEDNASHLEMPSDARVGAPLRSSLLEPAFRGRPAPAVPFALCAFR